MISATTLQLHTRCTVVVDGAAASRLKGADYYRWVFVNEPEWEEFRKLESRQVVRSGRLAPKPRRAKG